MKRICMFLILAAITALLTLRVHAQCSNATLTGSYPFIYNGQNAPGHSVTGKNTFGNAAVGIFTFDGAGTLTVTYTVVFNGHASSTSVPDTGTYTVNSDCTGNLTDTTINVHFNLATGVSGAEVFGIQTDPGNTDTFDAKKL
jgi:hypothetical protein